VCSQSGDEILAFRVVGRARGCWEGVLCCGRAVGIGFLQRGDLRDGVISGRQDAVTEVREGWEWRSLLSRDGAEAETQIASVCFHALAVVSLEVNDC
jgi:hypothetical protein